MVTFSSYNALGTTVEEGEITDGAVSYIKLGTDLNKWELLETMTFSADTGKTSGSLKVCNEYLIIGKLRTGTNSILKFQLNGDTAGNYRETYLSGAGLTLSTTSTGVLIQNMTNDTYPSYFQLMVYGKADSIGSATIPFFMNSGGQGSYSGLTGNWLCGSAVQVDNITFYTVTAQALTGEVKIYGR